MGSERLTYGLCDSLGAVRRRPLDRPSSDEERAGRPRWRFGAAYGGSNPKQRAPQGRRGAQTDDQDTERKGQANDHRRRVLNREGRLPRAN